MPLAAADAQCVQHDDERARGHADRREPWRHEAECAERHDGEVVAHRPTLVLAQHRERAPRDVECLRDRTEAPGRKDDVACRLRDLSARRERERHVRAGQHRRVVDAVADGDDARSLGPQRRKPRQLRGRARAGDEVRNGKARRDRRDLRACVTARDLDRDALCGKRRDRGLRVGTHALGEVERRDRARIVGEYGRARETW